MISAVRGETDGAGRSADDLARILRPPATMRSVGPAEEKKPPDVRVRGGALSQKAQNETESAIDLAKQRAVRLNPGTPKAEAGGSGGLAAPAKVMELKCPVDAASEVSFRLQFNLNSDTFVDTDAAEEDLKKIAVALKSFVRPEGVTPTDRFPFQFLLQGHTCDLGDDITNQVLSEKRALAVHKHLLALKVPAEMLLVLGEGEKRPAVDNDSDEHRARNRRVVIARVMNQVASAN